MYADDLLVLSPSPEGLQKSINVIKKHAETNLTYFSGYREEPSLIRVTRMSVFEMNFFELLRNSGHMVNKKLEGT